MMRALLRFRHTGAGGERGATAVGYGIMVALIAAVIVGVAATLGSQIEDAFQRVIEELGGGE